MQRSAQDVSVSELQCPHVEECEVHLRVAAVMSPHFSGSYTMGLGIGVIQDCSAETTMVAAATSSNVAVML